MRVFAIVALLLLAGCTAPEEEEPDLFGSCPQWIAGEAIPVDASVNGSDELRIEAPAQYDGRDLDMYVLSLESDAPIQVKAHAVDDGRRLLLKEADGEAGDSLITVDGEREVRAFLTPVEHGTAPGPTALRLELEGSGHLTGSVVPFYRVCGVPSDTGAT